MEESSSCACDEVGVLTTLGWLEAFTCKNGGTEGSVELLFVNRFKVLLKLLNCLFINGACFEINKASFMVSRCLSLAFAIIITGKQL